MPEIHTVIPVDKVNVPDGETQENIPQAELTYPLHTPEDATVPLQEPQIKSSSDESKILLKTPADEEREAPVPRDTPRDGDDETPAIQPEVLLTIPAPAKEKSEGQTAQSTPTDVSPRKTTPTTPSQEIRFNIPFSGVDEPYVILDTQERSPEAIYEQEIQPEVKSTPEVQARSAHVQQGKYPEAL